MMKSIGAGVSEVLTQEQKAGRKIEEDEEYIQKENEMSFHLEDDPKYRISAVGKWLENTVGEVIGDADIYFLHVMTGQRCESAWSCLAGCSEQNEKSAEKWETLCRRIGELENLEEIVCDEKRVEV